jgi:hypothetical protein
MVFDKDPESFKSFKSRMPAFHILLTGCLPSGLEKGLIPGGILAINWELCQKDVLHYSHIKQKFFSLATALYFRGIPC